MDYYSILGVPKDASDTDIKKAYKQKSMQHHPDRGGNEAKFKEINEAYSTLKDPHKRAMYDHQQTAGKGGFDFNTSNMGGFEDIFAHAFGQGFRRPQSARNPDIRIKVHITLQDVYNGKSIIVAYRLRNGQEQTVNLDIPVGANHGDTIRFHGLGDNSIPGKRGDLFVTIDILTDPLYTRNNNDITMIKKVNCLELIVGTKVNIKTPNDKNLELKIQPETKNGTVYSMQGYGLPSLSTNSAGTLFVKIEAEIPKNLTQNQIDKIYEVINGS